MELLYHLTVVIPTIVKTFLFMGVGIFLATVVWNLTEWSDRTLLWSVLALIGMLVVYYLWPWLTYTAQERVFSEENLSTIRLTKDDVLSQFYAGTASGIIASFVGWFAARAVLSKR